MTFILFIYIIGCVLAFIAFRRIQKHFVAEEWSLRDTILLAFVTLGSWFTIVSIAIVVVKMYFEDMED